MSRVINPNYKKYQQKIHEDRLFDDEELLMEAEDKKDNDGGLTNEELREIALDIAIDMSKLMEKVTPDDILKISRDVANYIKFHIIGNEYDPDALVPDKEDEKEEIVDNDIPDYDSIDDDEFTIEDDEDFGDDGQEDEEEPENLGETSGTIPNEFII